MRTSELYSRLLSGLALICIGTLTKGQAISVGLYPTAVPDSFEVRLVSTSGTYGGIVNMTATLRWEASAGGAVNSGDMATPCSALQLINIGGLVTSGSHNYCTLNILGLHPAIDECAITPAGIVAGGVRIRQLTGCRHVAIINDMFTDQNNLGYFISVGGVDLTGGIATGPIASGSCTPCEAPVITGITQDTLVMFCTTGQVDLFAAASGVGVEYQWYGPDPLVLQGAATMAGYEQWLHLADGVVGMYTAIAINDCGTDTGSVVVAQDTNCVPPQILSIDHTPLTCIGCAFDLSASVQSAGLCPQFIWTGPVEVADATLSTTVQSAVPGLYQLIASNGCGSDTMTEAVILYTGCDPPLILDVASNAPICDGDTLILSAQVADSVQTVSFSWIGYGPGGPYPVAENAPLVTLPDPHTAVYWLTVTNACGSSTGYVQTTVVSAVSNYDPVVCSFAGPFDIAMALGPHVGGGSWSLNGNPHSGTYEPTADSSGTYLYHDPSDAGCPDVPVLVTEYPAINNGTDSTVTLCSTIGPVDLFQYLGGDPDPGGTWLYNLDTELYGGVYDPALFDGGTFRYQNYCSGSPALLTIIENSADTLYEDADGDGLGDPQVNAIGCAVLGYVSNSDDACPSVAGTIGSPCDDGNASTVNDVLDSTCTCAGVLPVGIFNGAAGLPEILFWPNPSNGILTVLANDLSAVQEATLSLIDATGRVVLERPMRGPLMRLDVPTFDGLYTVLVQVGELRLTTRVVIN